MLYITLRFNIYCLLVGVAYSFLLFFFVCAKKAIKNSCYLHVHIVLVVIYICTMHSAHSTGQDFCMCLCFFAILALAVPLILLLTMAFDYIINFMLELFFPKKIIMEQRDHNAIFDCVCEWMKRYDIIFCVCCCFRVQQIRFYATNTNTYTDIYNS